jgi:hypothetical protein
MGVVMERWCPPQQMLGVFLMRVLEDWWPFIVIIGALFGAISEATHPNKGPYIDGPDDGRPSFCIGYRGACE